MKGRKFSLVMCVAAALAAVMIISQPHFALAESITIRASSQAPEKSLFSKGGLTWLLDEIEAKTEGRVSFERYYSGSLAKAKEQLKATGTGLAGMALLVPSYTPGPLPLANVATNPAIWSDSWVGSKAFTALYDEYPSMHKELSDNGVVLISSLTLPSYHIFGRDQVISNLDQLNGMKIMASGQIAVMLNDLGARITTIATPEGYEALQRGVVDGAVYGLTAAVTYSIHDVTKSLWRLPVGGLPVMVVMNKVTWDKIPEKDQNLIREAAAGHAEALHRIYQIEGDGVALKKISSAGITIVEPTDESRAALRKAASNTWANWKEKQDSEEISEMLDRFIELADKYNADNAENPFAGN